MLAEKAALLGRETEDEEGSTQIVPMTPGELEDPINAGTRGIWSPPPSGGLEMGGTGGGMSEKARGKMRATESTTSLSLNQETGAGMNGTNGAVEAQEGDEEIMKVAAAGVGPNKYVPTQEWVSSWQKG